MTARRYWRITRVESYGYDGLTLSDAALYVGGSRVDGSATLSCTLAPSSGTLAALSDAAFTPVVSWAEPSALPPGFALVWDFGGSPADITSVGIAGPSNRAFAHRFVLQSSDDGAAWATVAATDPASKFPGAGAFYTLLVADLDPYRDSVVLLLPLLGADGSKTFTDPVGGNVVIAVGAPTITTAQSQAGGSSLALDGSSYLRIDTLAEKLAGGATYTVEGWWRLSVDTAGQDALFGLHDATGGNILVVTINSVFGFNIPSTTFTTLALNVWHHVAVCRTPTRLTLWIGGVLVLDLVCTSYTIPAGSPFSIGQEFDTGPVASDFMEGNVNRVRVTAGVARYTAPFTPPVTPDSDPTPLRAGRCGPHRMISVFTPSAVTQAVISPSPAVLDLEHYGDGRIVGTTKNIGDPNYPVSRRVRLYRKRDGLMARETWSNVAGDYVFEHVRADIPYVVIGYDHTGLYNAVIADGVFPEMMP